MTMLVDAPCLDEDVRGEKQTPVNLQALPSAEIRNEVGRWEHIGRVWAAAESDEGSCSGLSAWSDLEGLVSWMEVPEVPLSQRSAVTVIEDLKLRLKIPLTTLIPAAGIVRRTYYSWTQDPGIEPRVGSAGRLWDLVACIEDLERIVSDPGSWLRGENRIDLLAGGRFSELIDKAIEASFPGAKRLTSPDYVANDESGPEWSLTSRAPELRPPRRATRVD